MKLKQMLLGIFLAGLLANTTRGACGEGTLACMTTGDEADTPILCDVTKHFVKSADGKNCEVKKVEGCQLAAANEASKPCMVCDVGLILDAEKKKCVAVATEKKIEGCEHYDKNDGSCFRCVADKFFSNAESKCLAVETTVANCLNYSDKTTCDACKENYYLKEKKCVEVPKVENCFKATDRVCDFCKSGFSMNKGWNQDFTVNEGVMSLLQGGALTWNILNQSGNESSVCQKQVLTNCAEYETYNACKTCASNYFVNSDKKCERFPEKSILNCSKYSTNVTCTQCNENYHVDGNPTTCKPVTSVTKCSKYKISLDKCEMCEAGNFLNEGSNQCEVRTRGTIANCDTLDPVADACKTCATNFEATTPASHKCLAVIPDCGTTSLQKGNDTADKHTCTACKDNSFYIDSDGTCKSRDVPFCKDYTGTTNNCLTCNPSYWLDGTECKASQVAGCLVYESNKNECKDCNVGFERVSKTSCTENQIASCTAYDKNTNDCTQCSGGKVINGNQCVDQAVPNCQVHVAEKYECTTCQTGYYEQTKACVEQDLSNCVEHVVSKNECAKCSLGYNLNIGDKTCKVNTTKNCASYTENKDECASCSKGYHLVGTACVRPTGAACVDFVDNSQTCSTCQAGKYKNGSNACVDVDVEGCIEYTPGTNTCIACAINYYLNTPVASPVCTKRDKTNCIAYTTNTADCSSCTFGYELNAGKACVAIVNNDCVDMNASNVCVECIPTKYASGGNCTAHSNPNFCKTLNKTDNKCDECEDGYFTDDSGATCKIKTLPNCEAYTSPKTENKCTKCVSTDLKKVVADACVNITTSTNCYASPGDTQDKCSECTPSNKISGNNCVTGGATASKFDKNCVGTDSADLLTPCTSCNANFSPGTGLTKSELEISSVTSNCEAIDSSGNCVRCEPGYKYEAAKTCLKYTGGNELIVCDQHQDESERLLSDYLVCETCKYESLTYLATSACMTREKTVNDNLCAAFGSTTDTCLGCVEGSTPEDTVETVTCLLNITAGTSSNCAVWLSADTCKYCERGFVENSGNCDPALANQHVKNAYDWRMTPSPTFNVNADVSTDCSGVVQTADDKGLCTKTSSSYVGIITFDKTNTTLLGFGLVDPSNGFSGKIDKVTGFTAVVPANKSYKVDSTAAMTTDCALGFQVSGNTTGYACLRSVDTKRCEIGSINNTDEDVAISTPILALVSCVTQSTSEVGVRLNHFMGDHPLDTNGYFPRIANFFEYDSCASSGSLGVALTTHRLIYMMFIDDAGLLQFVTKPQSSGNTSKFYCVPEAQVDTAMNCAFWFLKDDITETNFDGNAYSYTGKTFCGSCKPGYKPEFTGQMITGCSEIATADIDTSAGKNTLMGRAQTPVNGGWKYLSGDNDLIIDYGTPLTSAQAKDNCVAVDTDNNNKCVFCKVGWTAYKGECVPANLGGNNCQKSYGYTDYKQPSTDVLKMRQFSNMIMLRGNLLPNNDGFNTYQHVWGGCGTCGGGHKPHSKAVTTFKKCSMPPSGGGAANCKYLDISDKAKCYECLSTHTLETTGQTCETKITNCKEAKSTTCSKCDDGYVLDGFTCVVHNCKEWDADTPTECVVCDDNKGLDGTKKTHCSGSANTDTDCLNMSASLGFCVKSKTAGDVPYIIKNNATGVGITVLGTEHIAYDKTGNGYGMILSPYLYVTVTRDQTDSDKVTVVLNMANTKKYKNSTITKGAGTQPADGVCVPHRTLGNCKAGHDGLFCTECTGNNFLNSKGVCEAGPVLQCIKYNGNKCTECNTGFYLDAAGATQCLANTKSNCAMKSKVAHECSLCTWKYFKDGAGNCNGFSANNCKTRSGTTNNCADCMKGAFKDGNFCNLITKTNCPDLIEGEDKCSSCSDWYSMGAGPNGVCTMKTANLCKTFNLTDTCATCFDGFKAGAKDCEWGTAENCGGFNPSNADACSTCGGMYTLSGGNCVTRTAANCKTYSADQTKDECGDCAGTFWKNATTCAKTTEKHCSVSKGASDGCQTCLGGFDVNGSFTCDHRTNGTCETYTNDNKCLTCLQGKYFDGTDACVANDAANCQLKSTTDNECQTCLANYWKDTGDSNICKENTSANCTENGKSQSANECSTCLAQHYKDGADNNNCKAHTAQNCETYHLTSDECLTCKAGTLEGSSGGKKTCSAYTTTDCKKLSLVKDECSECELATHFLHDNGTKKVCSARTATNCKTFDSSLDKCLTCNQKTYLKEGKCEDVTAVDKCKTYSVDLDKCTECEDGNYKSASKNECWLYPDGIEGCVMYSDRTTCTACDSDTFLSGGKCETVTGKVTDCQEYKSATECQKCKSGKTLETNECKTITASNCLEITDAATCKSCLAPYVFNTGEKKCETIGITDCVKGTYHSAGNTCTVCNSGKVLSSDNKKCESPTTNVANCQDYSDKTKCKKCIAGHILSGDGSKCTAIGSTAGANCSVASTVADPVCDVCRFGNVKNTEGVCVKSELDYCLVASTDLKTCKLCSPTSYMDKAGKCVAPVVTPESMGVWSALMAIVLTLLVL